MDLFFILGDLLQEVKAPEDSLESKKCYFNYLNYWYERLYNLYKSNTNEAEEEEKRIETNVLIEVNKNFSKLKSRLTRDL